MEQNNDITWGYKNASDEYTGPTVEQEEKNKQYKYKKFMYQRLLETPEQWYAREISEMIQVTKGCIRYNPSSAVTDEMLLEGMLKDYENIKQRYEVIKELEPERLMNVEHVTKLLKELEDGTE